MKKGRKGLAALLVMVMVITIMGGFNVAQKTEVNADEKTYYAGNPIITNMFTADPSAHVWEKDGRIYIYASHDIFPSRGCDLMDKYHVFSSDNMVTWRDEGEILSSDDVSWGREEGGLLMQLMKTEHIIFISHTQQVQEMHGIIHGELVLQRVIVLQADLSVLMMVM